jgi:hypothetical protein
MAYSSSQKEEIRNKAYDWMLSPPLEKAYTLVGWKPVFETLEVDRHLFWAELFKRLDAPDNLHGLRSVLYSIEWMAKDLKTIFKSDGTTFQQIITDIEHLRKSFDSQQDTLYAIYDSNDFYGILTKHPIYSLLMSAKGDQTHFTQFALYPVSWLLVFLANPIIDSGRLYTINKEFRRIASELSLSVKGTDEFSGESKINDALNEILNTNKETPSEYNKFFEDWGLKAVLKIIRQITVESHHRLGTGYGGKVFGAKVIGLNNQVAAIQGKYKNIPTQGYSEDIGEFQLKSFVNNSIFQHKEPSLKVIEPLDHALTTMIEVPTSGLTRRKPRRKTKTAKPEAELDTVKRKVNAKYLGDTVIRENQHFITSTSILDDYTLEILIVELQHWYQSPFDLQNTKQGIHPTIAVAVLATCLFYGKPLEQTIRAVRKRALNNVDGYFISETKEGCYGHWLLEPPLAGLVKNNTTYEHTEEVDSSYRIPMPLWLTQVLLRAENIRQEYTDLDLIDKNHEKTLKQLGFVWTVEEFSNAYEAFFSQVRKKYPGIELNLRLVEQYLQNASFVDYDVIFSAYFTNKRTIFSHTQLFYSRIEEKGIYSKFAEFWDARLFELSLNNSELSKLNEWPKLKDSRYIGSALVPKKTAVEKIVTDLQTHLKQQEISSLTDIIHYHQTYTLYTMVFLSYSTGYRGVHDLLPSWRLLSGDGKWLAISDKDDQDASHTRLCFLAPLIRKHLQNYQNHLDAILSKILLIDFGLYEQLINAFRDWKLKLDYRNTSERFSKDETIQGVFFGIDIEKQSIQAMSLNYFFDDLNTRQHIELPANGGRHLIRTEGLAEGIPCDLLDAFLGHFIYGKEPHSVYSALAIHEIELGMKDFLEQHLKSLGFKAIQSKLIR